MRSTQPGVLAFMAACLEMVVPASRVAAAEPVPTLRRYAIIASSNDGGGNRARLRFADSDARAVADVLTQLGGLSRQDMVLVPNATREALQRAFEQIEGRLAGDASAQPRRELIVYYSGHSDELGLLLGAERVNYVDLRAWIEAAPADVRIAIFDSCASGAVIRERGGVHRAPFLNDLSVQARGSAFLTASSADEAAQESDRLAGGFFTHFLVSGLRGAADVSRDSRVTLGEAYQFAYDETLRRTQTAPSAQHPAYEIQLTGTGELVLTDLRSTSASLVLDEPLAGRVYVRDAAGRLVVELEKQPTHPIQLGLSPGSYLVTVESPERRFESSITLQDGKVARLRRADLSPAAGQLAMTRGSAVPVADSDAESKPPSSLLDRLPTFGFYAGLALRYARLYRRDSLLAGFEAALLLNHRLAFGVSVYGWGEERGGESLGFGYAGAIVRYHFLFDSPFSFSIAALAAGGGIQRKVESPARTDSDAVFVFEPQLSGHLSVTRFLRLGVDFGYRAVAGLHDFAASDLRGFLGGFHAQLGWF